MAVRLLIFCVVFDAHVCTGCALCYMPLPGSLGVPSLWHCYFGGCGLECLGTPVLE